MQDDTLNFESYQQVALSATRLHEQLFNHSHKEEKRSSLSLRFESFER